jgi:Integrase core domain
LPLEDCLDALQATLPPLTRSALHRCLPRHGISRLPDMAGEQPAKKRFQSYPIGSCHLDIAAVRTEAGKLCLVVAIDRAAKFAYAALHGEANNMVAAQFLRNFMATVPDMIHPVLTDHGIQCANRTRDISALQQIFDRVCHEHGIDHRLTTTHHPGPHGQGERMNRTLKEATVK